MDIRKFQKEHGISTGELIMLLRKKYGCFNKSTLCMISNPDKYGVRLTTDAEKYLRDSFGVKVVKRSRRKANRLQVRVDDAQLKQIKDTMDYLECASAQDFLSLAIANMIFEGRARLDVSGD